MICTLLACVVMSVSAYCDTGPTRWGDWRVPAQHGVVSCGPNWRPGTIVLIPGLGVKTCMDTGGMVTDAHLDVWMESEEEALTWGRQTLVVVVIR